MITGVVRAEREAIFRLEVRGLRRHKMIVESVLDTGFTGYLTLPAAVTRSLALASQGVREALLADGRSVALEIYRARVLWHGQVRPIQVLAAEGGCLAGMALLAGSRVSFGVVPGGRLTIKPIR